MNKKLNQGFTLVELAIVIVIIGLLVGGVLQGQELIKQAEVRKIGTEYTSYLAANMTFYSKYNCIAGDCPNAFTFFNTNCGTNTLSRTINGNTGCNGNGNNVISYAEGQRFWQHLGLANMIKGTYDGNYNTVLRMGIDMPIAPLKGSAWGVMDSRGQQDNETFTWATGSPYFPTGKNILMLGNAVADSSFYIRAALFDEETAFSIDNKYDDGKSWSGLIIGSLGRIPDGSGGWTNSVCGNITTGIYNLSSTSPACIISIDMGL